MQIFFIQRLMTLILFQTQFEIIFQKLSFYGDISFYQFLKNSCYKTRFLLIDQIKSNETFTSWKAFYVNLFLRKIHCQYMHFSNVTLTTVVKQMINHPNTLNRNIQVIFDLSNFKLHKNYNQIVSQISRIFSQCFNCNSFILYFDSSLNSIISYFNAIFNSLSRDFQAIVVSGRSMQTVHIRPVLNGCHLLDDLFVPKTTADFAQLRVPNSKCNFYFKTLNVSVVNVSFFSCNRICV